MTVKLDPRFVFDRGIDRIVRRDESNASSLPDSGHLLPPDARPSAELDKLLALPNLQDFVAADLQPQVLDGQILTPQGFQRALQAAIATLRNGQLTVPAARRPALAKALALLQHESELRSLVALYRNALLQG